MANSVAIRTTAPGAKEAAGQLGMLKAQVVGLGSAKAGPLGGLTSGMGGASLAMLGAVGAGVAIGSVLTDIGGQLGNAANAAIADQKSTLSLTQALKDNIPLWDGNLSRIEDVTDAAINLGFADDDTREAIQKGVIATRDLDTTLRLLNIAYDVARGRNIDLGSAMDIVLKANIGNSKALKQMGIDLGTASGKTELLAALQERFNGQAEAYPESFAGKLDVTNQKFGEMQEDIGYGVLPVLEGMMDFISGSVIPGLGNLGDAISDVFNPPQRNSILGQELDEIPHKLAAIPEAASDIGPRMDALLHGAFMGIFDPIDEEAKKAFQETQRTFNESAWGLGNSLADGLRSTKDDIGSAMDDLMWAIKHPLALTKQIAAVEAALTGKKLQEGLNSQNPEIKRQAEQTQARLRELWTNLNHEAYPVASDTSLGWQTGLNSHYPTITSQAAKMARDVNDTLDSIHNHVKVSVDYTRGGGLSGKARGGRVKKDEPIRVGEEGEEVFVPDSDGTVIPHGASAPTLASTGWGGGNGNGPMKIDVQVNLSTREYSQKSKHYATMQSGAGGFR